MKNVGTAILTLAKMAIGGANGGDFKSTSRCLWSLAVNGICTVQVTFTPAANGQRSGRLSIYDNDAYQNSPQVLTLTGTGTT